MLSNISTLNLGEEGGWAERQGGGGGGGGGVGYGWEIYYFGSFSCIFMNSYQR